MTRFGSKVVDLNEFKAARALRQLDLLAPGEAEGLAPSLAEGLAPSEAEGPAPGDDRPLSGRDLAHRARMLAHLEAVRR